MKKTIYLIWTLCLIVLVAYPQAPQNDNCVGAISLTSSTNCNQQNFSNLNATQSLNPALCGGFTSTSAKDVWFSFTASGSGDSVIAFPTGSFDPILEVYSGSCGSLLSLGCSDGQNASAIERVSPGNLISGNTYFARVYGWAGATGSFSLCVRQSQAVTPPANDNCLSAINLTPSSVCSLLSFNSTGATQSLAPVSCNGAISTAARDVWFTFTASNAGDSVIVTPSGTFDPVVQLFEGSACGSLQSIACSDDPNAANATEKIATAGLIVGNTYRVRVYGWAGATGSFSICIKQPGLAPPSNDNCGTTVFLNPGINCNPQTFSNNNATQTLPPAACGATPAGIAADVWFAFAPATSSDTIIVSPIGNFNPVVEIFSGICANPVSAGCSNDAINSSGIERLSPGGLTPGVLYWVRVYGFNGQQGAFGICAKRGSTAAPPSNDNCNSAIAVAPSANCTGPTYSNAGSTQSQAAVLCSGATSTLANDVWFSFVASGSGDSVIVTPQGTFDAVVELFSGTFCTSLTSLACSDNPTVGTATEKISTGTLVAGNTYRVRVYGWAGIEGQFSICVRQSSTSPPANDNCQNAINLIPSASCNSITYNNTGATQSLAPISCGGATSSSAQDVWFSFSASNAGDSIIVIPFGSFDPVVQIFGGSSCNNLVPLVCKDNRGSITEKIAFGGLSVGVTYRIRVYGWAGTVGPFSICIKQPAGSAPANDNCNASITLATSLTCNPQTFTTVGATQSLAPTACGGIPSTSAQDVWFKFGPVLTQGDSVIVSPVGGFNPVVEFYSGICTNLTSLACSNNSFNPAAVEKVSPGNLNLSMIYYVRVYGFNGSQGQFNICVKAATSGPAITNDNCTSATEVSVSQFCFGQNASTSGATQSLAPVLCNGGTSTSALDVWYKFTAVTPGDTIRVAGDFDPVVELFSGTCSNLVSIACSDGPNASDVETLAPGNLTPGQVYFFRVFGYNGSSGNFAFCVRRAANCNSVAGTFSLNTTETVSNSIAILNLSGSSPGASVQWQVSLDNLSWSNSGSPVFQVSDTFYVTSVTTQTYYIRAQVTLSSCATANSNSAPLIVNCATPLTNKEPALSGYGIAGFNFAGLNNTSIHVAPSGAYQNFRLLTGQVCRGNTYPFTITGLQNNQSAKAIWIDFNNNGSFADAGENVVVPNVTTGNLSGSISIPSNVSVGIVRIRVMLYSPGTSFPSADPCFAGPYAAGEIEEYSLNISSAPTLSNAGSNTTICSSSYVLSANIPASGSGQWSVVSGTGTFSNSASASSTVSGLSIGLNVLRWTISTPCSSSISDVSITVIGSGQTPFAGQDQSVCGGQVTLSANTPSAGTGLWTVVSGNVVFANPNSPATTAILLTQGVIILRWTISNPPCNPVSDDVQITNLGGSAVTADAGADQSLCVSSATLAGNNPGIGSGLWTLVAGSGTIVNPSSPNTQISNLGVGTNVFRWTITTGNCPASSDDVIFIREASPSVPNAGQDQSICTGQTQLSAAVPTSGSGVWTLITGSGQIANPLNPNTTVAGLSNGINVFRWTIYNGSCNPVSDDVIIATNLSAVSATAGPDQVVCAGEANLSGNNPGNGSGQWTLVSGSGSFANAASENTTVSGLGIGVNVFRWTISSAACSPSSDEIMITRLAPAIPFAGADQQICAGQVSLAAVSPSAGTGIWSLVSGAGSINNPTDPNTVVSGLGNGPNVFRWTVSNLPCAAVFDEVTITTNLSAVAANAGPDQSVCGYTVLLSGNDPGSGIGTWALVQGSGNITSPNSLSSPVSGLGAGTNVFSWTINPGGSCAPTTDYVTITTFDGLPATAGNDQSVCGNSATLSGNNPGNASGSWSLVSGSGDIVNPFSPSSSVINLGSGTNIFRWTIVNSPCPSSSDDVSIVSTPSGLQVSAGADQTVCGSTANFNALVPVNGNGSWTVVSGGAVVAQPGNAVSAVSNLGEGLNIFLWTVSSGACSASDVVNIIREPNLLNLGNDTLLCQGEFLSLSAGGAYASYLWSDNSNNQVLIVNQSGEYWLQATSINGCIFNDTIQVVLIPCTGTADALVSGTAGLRVFPNPTEGKFRISNNSPDASHTSYRVISTSGRVVYASEERKSSDDAHLEIDLQGLPAGLYLLEAYSPSGRMIQKIMLR